MNVKEYLLSFLSSVYCDTCVNQGEDSPCEECHRKAMCWKLSEQAADTMAKEIAALKPDAGKGE